MEEDKIENLLLVYLLKIRVYPCKSVAKNSLEFVSYTDLYNRRVRRGWKNLFWRECAKRAIRRCER